jgi:hypothetical protein
MEYRCVHCRRTFTEKYPPGRCEVAFYHDTILQTLPVPPVVDDGESMTLHDYDRMREYRYGPSSEELRSREYAR